MKKFRTEKDSLGSIKVPSKAYYGAQTQRAIQNFEIGWAMDLNLVLPLIIVSYVVGLSIEFAFAVFRKHPVNEGYLVTG